jgi:hypothetical protein
MGTLRKACVLGWLLALVFLSPLHAQTATAAPADSTATAAKVAPTGQAPDEATKKITELVHAGKYAEAQQLTAGLLIAYPNDQRLIKAKALIEKLLAPAGPAHATPGSKQPTDDVPSAKPASVEQLTGMDRVDYDALIELARQAQQNPDLEQQEVSLGQFMDQSGPFLQKHPDQMLLWQLRAAGAISLNSPTAGYEAGQKLLAMGAADGNDLNLRRLLAQLKNRGYLDRQDAERQATYDWIVGTWSVSFSYDGLESILRSGHASRYTVEFSKSASVIEGHSFYDGVSVKPEDPRFIESILNSSVYRGTILAPGEIRWEWTQNRPGNSSGWVPAMSFDSSEDKRTMTIVFSSSMFKSMGACTLLFTRIDTKQ